MDLEIKHFRLVVAIAETGSVTRAGQRLYLTQSALSHQLRDIEDRLNAKLFHRVGKRMVPTATGAELIRSAAQVLDLVGRTEEGIRRRAEGRTGLLRISTGCYTCYHWLPAILKEYRVAHPGVDVRIDAAATHQPIKGLLDGRLDLAITSDRARDRRLLEKPLFEDELLVVVAPSHPFAARRSIAPREFASETLFIYPPREESSFYQRVLVPAGVAPKALEQIQLTEAILELVKAGLGVTVMAGWVVEPYVRGGALRAIPLGPRRLRRQWTAAVLPELASAPFANDFIRLLAAKAPAMDHRAARRGLLRFERPQPARTPRGHAVRTASPE
jgi:LysR family transcriptional regulator for metE and metH